MDAALKNLPTQAERNLMVTLDGNPDVSRQSFRSKATLKQLSKLVDIGMIDFDPFAGQATLTAAGRSFIAKTVNK